MTDREAIRRLAEIVNDVIRAIRPEACFPHMKQKENLQEVRDLIEALAEPAAPTNELPDYLRPEPTHWSIPTVTREQADAVWEGVRNWCPEWDGICQADQPAFFRAVADALDRH